MFNIEKKRRKTVHLDEAKIRRKKNIIQCKLNRKLRMEL